ncbi:hypothetical protein D7X55_19135 [Corallococcus sp. AB049A]|uniref:Uncharacterized protein n=1 Tax=Corallococcus interemptor TaxID=2316720 RepID=A0A3A8QQQ1_9BACT|nr:MULTISPECIES: hypothetical protein [Corallococcus]RKH46799.1 hypothetical protein D7Y23_23095 [Corallococcus sp. AB050B]RKH68695.1 hypothetical protein D7X96_16920 [Corallococcus interemptor]RKI63828.1 hypothetical protein D7X55_19135 [Corallococcus sp. AB049A]
MSPLIPYFVLSPIVAGGLVWWSLTRLGKKRNARAKGSLDAVVTRLKGQKATGTVDLFVQDVSWSGETELSPQNCRVRVVMGGRDAAGIPPRFEVEVAPGAPRPSADVLAALRVLDEQAMEALKSGGWNWQRPTVSFEPASGVTP